VTSCSGAFGLPVAEASASSGAAAAEPVSHETLSAAYRQLSRNARRRLWSGLGLLVLRSTYGPDGIQRCGPSRRPPPGNRPSPAVHGIRFTWFGLVLTTICGRSTKLKLDKDRSDHDLAIMFYLSKSWHLH
jgi:hypothetical protein